MARENHPRDRQLRKLARKDPKLKPYERILIVCEGKKTEPNYFNEIRRYHNIPSASVVILQSQFGTSPIQVVNYAYKLFLDGDYHLDIQPKSYDRVFAVFDRDDHESYYDALQTAKKYHNELQLDGIIFKAFASVPCFELWLLIHYESIQYPIGREDVLKKLKKRIHGYEKGGIGYYSKLLNDIDNAIANAQKLRLLYNADDGENPFTEIDILVLLLEGMGKP